jgi:hypothetical protein
VPERARLRTAVLLVAASSAISGAAAAQATDTLPAGVTVGRFQPRASVDTLRLVLRRGGQYRSAAWPQTATVRVIARAKRGDDPFVVPVSTARSQQARFELYPQRDGEHELIYDAGGAGLPGLLVVTEDTAAEARIAERRLHAPHVGLSVVGGPVSGYLDADSVLGRPGTSGHVEVALMIRTSPGLTLEIGVGNDPRPPAYLAVAWYFGEVQFARHQWIVGGHAFEIAPAVRYSKAGTDGVRFDRSAIAVGPFMAWHFDRRTDGRGVMLSVEPQFTYSFDPRPAQAFVRVGIGVAVIP